MSNPNIVIDMIGGNCPVQAEGTIEGKPFYFRARGQHWSLSVGGQDPVINPDWSYEEAYGEGPFDAGWMSEEEARGFLEKAAGLYMDRDNAAPKP
ncbi:hypothetical protein [Parasphingorhabdus sp.]|uniref:hypothetical protein n=1 Tax=Parasphingorhabdus sp. TaxID=2709688 RepID=UPI00329824A9